MHPNAAIFEQFYTAMQARDFATLRALYHPDTTFSDEAYRNLNYTEVNGMWEMLLTRGKDLKIEFEVHSTTDSTVTGTWVATYTFTLTGQKVRNVIRAHMELRNGKILAHRDRFDFYKWARQAFGFKGLLLGWTPFFKNKVHTLATKSLHKFLAASNDAQRG